MKLVQKTKKDGKNYMARSKNKKEQLTYHQMENILREMAEVVQQLMERMNNLEYGVFSYIEFRKTGKRFNKWMDKRSEQAQTKEEVKNAIRKDETIVRENLEGTTASQGRGTEGIRTP